MAVAAPGLEQLPVVHILQVPVHRLTMNDVIYILKARMKEGVPTWVVTANAELVVRADEDPGLIACLRQADITLADGAGIVWAARIFGVPVPQRIPGIELAERLLEVATREGWRVYFLGAQPGVAEVAISRWRQRLPDLQVIGWHHGYFSLTEEPAVVERIRRFRPDILLVGMGAPRQEIWLAEHFSRLNVGLAMGIGGSFDVWAGRVKRAPHWLGELGLEWLYRLVHQPWRSARMLALPRFVYKVLRAKWLGQY